MSEQSGIRTNEDYTPRERLYAMLSRAELDPTGFGAELKADPMAALRAAGFTDSDAQNLMAGNADQDESLVLIAGSGCADTTCGISICPSTCFITIPAGNPSTCALFSILPQ